jgi:hypothetical protein
MIRALLITAAAPAILVATAADVAAAPAAFGNAGHRPSKESVADRQRGQSDENGQDDKECQHAQSGTIAIEIVARTKTKARRPRESRSQSRVAARQSSDRDRRCWFSRGHRWRW